MVCDTTKTKNAAVDMSGLSSSKLDIFTTLQTLTLGLARQLVESDDDNVSLLSNGSLYKNQHGHLQQLVFFWDIYHCQV